MVNGLPMHVASAHSPFDDLSFDLPKTGNECRASCILRHKETGGSEQRIHDVTWTKSKLLDRAGNTCTHDSLVQLDLRLRFGGLGARLLSWKQRGNLGFECPLFGVDSIDGTPPALYHGSEPLDFAP